MFALLGLFIGLVGLFLLLPYPALGLSMIVFGLLIFVAANSAKRRHLEAKRHRELMDVISRKE